MTDASLLASGGVLMQWDENGNLHPCTYLSQTFTRAEQNYNIYDRELLAVIHAPRPLATLPPGNRTPCHSSHQLQEFDLLLSTPETILLTSALDDVLTRLWSRFHSYPWHGYGTHWCPFSPSWSWHLLWQCWHYPPPSQPFYSSHRHFPYQQNHFFVFNWPPHSHCDQKSTQQFPSLPSLYTNRLAVHCTPSVF